MLEGGGGDCKGFCTEGARSVLGASLIQLLWTLQIGLGFCFAVKCFFNQCDFLNFFFFFFGWRVSLWEAEPIWGSSFGPPALSTEHA